MPATNNIKSKIKNVAAPVKSEITACSEPLLIISVLHTILAGVVISQDELHLILILIWRAVPDEHLFHTFSYVSL